MTPKKRRTQLWIFSSAFVLLSLLQVTEISGLSNLRVAIPETVQRGQDVMFNCSFNLQEDDLYAVKWYRGTYEIFRFIPSEKPSMKMFPLNGFNISETLSTGRSLYMHNVDFVNSGAYSCEVIADLTFHTLIKSKEMLVIDLPDDKPRITAVKETYSPGDNVNAMCTSWQSHPPANLTWFINGEPAREGYLIHYPLRKEFDGTFTRVLGLRFDLTSMHFAKNRGNIVNLKCTSTLLSIYWQSSEVRIKQQHSYYGSYNNKNGAPPSSTSIGRHGHTGNKNAKGGGKSGGHTSENNIIHPQHPSKQQQHQKSNSSTAADASPSKPDNTPVELLTSHVLSQGSCVSSMSNVLLLAVSICVAVIMNV